MKGYLRNCNKNECLGCSACEQICPKKAIEMSYDEEGFMYPKIDNSLCIKCGLCHKVCPIENEANVYNKDKYCFGGYIKDRNIRADSTSGGAFSAIVESNCTDNYVIFGAESEGLKVFHSYIENKDLLYKFRKSKYSQSIIGDSYKNVKKFLREGKFVIFSGTPCQIAGLKNFLSNKEYENLLTVEVICEGVPSPLYIKKLNNHFIRKYNSSIKNLDYRFKDSKPSENPKKGKWDFEVMRIKLSNGKAFKKDRWINPFWSIWLNHLMSRPSCYKCPFNKTERVADITLGDLWGVHLYCPELYGKNLGSSIILCNSEKGKVFWKNAEKLFYGHELDFNTALKYQSPLRKNISKNEDRELFIEDLKNENIPYKKIVKKWANKPTLKLLYNKYIYGNRQKIYLWNLKNRKVKEND